MEIVYSKLARKNIKALNLETRSKIITAIEKLPLLGDIKKLHGYTNMYRLRVGGLRVLYEFDDGVLSVNAVLPRGDAYK